MWIEIGVLILIAVVGLWHVNKAIIEEYRVIETIVDNLKRRD